MTRSIALHLLRRFDGVVGPALRSLAAVVGIALATAACSGTEMVAGLAQPYPACDSGNHAMAEDCSEGSNVLMAMATGRAIAASDVVEEEVLEEQRGGFITVGGLQVDFGFEFTTMVNGTPQLTSVLTLNDIISGNGIIPSTNSISVTGGANGVTDIIHAVGPNGIGATIVNSQDGVDLANVSTLAIDIIGLRNVHKGGRALGNGQRMPMEMQQALIRGLSR